MPKAKSKPIAPVSPAVPIAMDLERIAAAMRVLADIATREDHRMGAILNGPTADTEIGQLIANPLGSACRNGFRALKQHLAVLLGERDANELGHRILAEALKKAAPELTGAAVEPVVKH